MPLKWTRLALGSVEAEAARLARENPQIAKRTVKRIHDAVRTLCKYPALGRPGRIPGTRELSVPAVPYVVPYRVRDDHVEILCLLHVARRHAS
ncbi:MAG: putative toxin Y4kP [Candidatus Tectimicrobiota bacterium]|nr:MAG: putative toxin Y4kP [Candidatus Tectomicrobia bacterium]